MNKDSVQISQLLFPDVKTTPEEILKRYPPRVLPEGAVVSRYAPSPTGMMHMGNFFQMFIASSLVRLTGGVMFLRVEDTDSKREVKGALEVIYNILSRFEDIKFDEYQTLSGKDVGDYGPYVQSQRTEIYKVFAKKLVAEGKAFPCFCRKTEGKADVLEMREGKWEDGDGTDYDPCRDLSLAEIKEHLDNGESFAIRLKTAGTGKERIKFFDLIKGEIETGANAKDFVLLKSDGIPPYAFAHAIDDTLMGTRVVVRGEEYISSTAQHVELFHALGFPVPVYCHNPLICKIGDNGGRRKLSKRLDPEANMMFYFEKGYPTDGVLEYLTNLISSGFEIWRKENPDAHWTEYTFDIHHLSASAPLLDIVKLNDVCKNVISRWTSQKLYQQWLAFAQEFDSPLAESLEKQKDYFLRVCEIGRDPVKPRKDIFCMSQMKEEFDYMFQRPKIEVSQEEKSALSVLAKLYHDKILLTKEGWFDRLKEVAIEAGFCTDNKLYKANPEKYAGNTAKACELVRLAITGRRQSPDLFEIMHALGEDEVKTRLEAAFVEAK